MELIVGGLIAIGLWYYTQADKFLKEYQIKVKYLKIDFQKSAQWLYSKLIVNTTLTINNPSQLVATLSKLQLSAWYDGKLIGSLVKNDPITLQAGNMNYTFEIALNTLPMFGSALKAIEAFKAGKSISIQLKGFGEVGKATITVNETVKLI